MLLIRHGETPWNAAGRWQGHADPGLTEKGLAQARTLAAALREDAASEWRRIVASDLARAQQTAEQIALALGLAVDTDRRLRELDVGAWSGLTREQIRERDPETLRVFESGDPLVRPGGGESRQALRERALDFARELASDRAGEAVIVVTHRGVVRALAPGANPSNAERLQAVVEEIVSRGSTARVDSASAGVDAPSHEPDDAAL
jgi:broad specificity phosphatase PhoE